jgi:hypothetical protein
MLWHARASPLVVFRQSKRKDVFFFLQVQWVIIVKHYRASCSYFTCQNEFRDAFPDSPVPDKSTISCLVNCFLDTRSVQDRNHSGQPSVLSDDSLDDIHQTLLHSPWKSLRKLSLEIGSSYGSVHKAANILKLHPYHVHVMHELKEPDKEKWLQYCRWFTHFIWWGVDILDKDFYIDEAWFHLSGYINSQNSRIWNAVFQMSLQKLFIRLQQTWGKEWMHASLNPVDISNT